MSDDDLAAYQERVAESQALEDMRERRKEREKRHNMRSGFCTPGNPADSHARCSGSINRGPKYGQELCLCECHAAIELSPGAFIEVVPTVTPTARLVTAADPKTDEWYAARREGITGTDLPKILGITKYGNALSVWLDKRGELEDMAGEEAMWGNILEDPIAQRWAELHNTAVTDVGVLAHIEHDWMRISLDRLVETCPDGDGPCALEIKTRSAFVAESWRDEIPDDVLAQTTWGLMVTGLGHHHVAVLLGGQRLKSFRVDRDEKLEAYLLDAARPIWAAVTEGVPPEAHPDAEGVLLDLLDRMYSKRAGDRPLEADKAQAWLDQYAEGGELERRGKALKTEAKTALVQMIDDGDAGTIDELQAFTYKAPPPSDTFTSEALRTFRRDNPELYEALKADGYITLTDPSPRFVVKARNQ